MAHPVVTTGTVSTVSTTKRPNESTEAWVTRHNSAVDGATPGGNTLTTSYTSAGGAEVVVTNRINDETDASFLARHEADYVSYMGGAPPIP